jgi:hypothetical protein
VDAKRIFLHMGRIMRTFHAFILLLLAASFVEAQGIDPLRQAGEKTLFAFQMAGSAKWVSLCESEGADGAYIAYRYGAPTKIELNYPERLPESWDAFEYSYYLRGGGSSNEGLDLNYVSFQVADWKYVVYQEYSAETDSTEVGIRLTNLKDKKKYDLRGNPKTMQGTLVQLRDEERMPKGEVPN